MPSQDKQTTPPNKDIKNKVNKLKKSVTPSFPLETPDEDPQYPSQDLTQQTVAEGTKMTSLQELTRCALFTAIALTIFMIESRLPAPITIPGAKLGLSNAVTLYVVYTMGVSSACKVLFSRILLGAFFSGQLLTLLYSATGGLFCLIFLSVVRPHTNSSMLWFISPCSAICHNLGQLLVASYVLGSTAVFYYLPYLVLLSIGSGLFVGISTRHLLHRLHPPTS